MTVKLNQFLTDLMEAPSPSGYEKEATLVFERFCYELELSHEFTDSIGNAAFSVGKLGGIPFMVSGHIDEIAMQVQHIDDNGFIHFIKDGGIDPKTLAGRNVVICNNHNLSHTIPGVIGKTPIHVEFHTDDKDKVTKIKNLKIDVGASNKQEAIDMGIEVGQPIVFDKMLRELGKNRISACGIDDKIGVYITGKVLKTLKEMEKTNPLKGLLVYGVACTQEEVGGYGASLAAKRINPKYSIDYDVTFATDDGNVDKNEWGDIKLGGGGCIAYGPDKNIEMCNLMSDICKKCDINYQPFSVGAGATNTCKIKMAADDCKTLLLSVPERNMHTPVEVCDLRDIESLVSMTVNFIYELDRLIG